MSGPSTRYIKGYIKIIQSYGNRWRDKTKTIMFYNSVFTICLLVSFICPVVIGSRTQKVSATILEGYPDQLEVTPFTRVGNKLYHVGQSKVSWFKANLICRSMGGYLASFDNQQEFQELSDHLIANYPTDRWWWISGSDLDSEGNFYWYRTGEPVKYADWSDKQPDNAGGNENCMHLWYQSTKYQMNDWICKKDAFYICEADKPTTVVVSVF
ncbi:C-type lectin 37Db isoform X2 [Musca domestica]|uniref:C-type lectin 37Db isoform X2 n=1 Tax=Musca domestica TaxID=7370 RepID=A0A9J7DA10_MUSDO|nr:C-type lectin 37Db isoform X2 [Musca domestica]